ncbi:MAG: GNAT family N-acetyltransferase [archaeon]|nr:GNAT family N-acetyltransferase [archaeon]
MIIRMNEIPFPLKGYTLTKIKKNDDVSYFLSCIKETILSSVSSIEKNLSSLWIDDIISVVSCKLSKGPMLNEAFKLSNEARNIGILWMGKSRDQYTCDDTGYLLGIFIEKNERRKGLGQALLDSAELWCKLNSLVSITLNVGAHNKEALNLYSSAGYEPQSTIMKKFI